MSCDCNISIVREETKPRKPILLESIFAASNNEIISSIDTLWHKENFKNEPIRVLIEYIDSLSDVSTPLSPTDRHCSIENEKFHKMVSFHSSEITHYSLQLSNSIMNYKGDSHDISNQIFALDAEKCPFIQTSDRQEIMKERRVPTLSKHKTNSNEHVEIQRRSKVKGINKKQILKVENKAPVEMTHSIEAKKVKKRGRCHWTRGNKMFSKTEKVLKNQLLVE